MFSDRAYTTCSPVSQTRLPFSSISCISGHIQADIDTTQYEQLPLTPHCVSHCKTFQLFQLFHCSTALIFTDLRLSNARRGYRLPCVTCAGSNSATVAMDLPPDVVSKAWASIGRPSETAKQRLAIRALCATARYSLCLAYLLSLIVCSLLHLA